MKKNISLVALIEMSGSLLLLLCMFLPWFQFSLNESVESFSFWGRTGFVNWAEEGTAYLKWFDLTSPWKPQLKQITFEDIK